MNEVILLLEIAVVFSLVVTVYKIFGRDGLLLWPCVAVIVANVTTIKSVMIFGLNIPLGNVLFASTFLATDILTERYGSAQARKSVYLSLFGALCFVVVSQIALWYTPGEYDVADAVMQVLLGMDCRVTLAGITMLLIANIADISIYEKIKQLTQGRYIWVRNNVATIFCNCVENVFFMLLGFCGIYTVAECLEMALAVSVVEAFIGVCDTPFLYLALRGGEGKHGEARA